VLTARYAHSPYITHAFRIWRVKWQSQDGRNVEKTTVQHCTITYWFEFDIGLRTTERVIECTSTSYARFKTTGGIMPVKNLAR
jgi:hypothetical protein